MRLLLINPNTSTDITALLVREGETLLGPGAELSAVTAPYGVPYIARREDLAVAGVAALAAYREALAMQDYDVVLLGCFGDPGLAAIRNAATCPVVTLADAACAAAAAVAQRFSVVTAGTDWLPILKELFDSWGYGMRVASIHALPMGGDDVAAAPEAALEPLAELVAGAVRDDGAEAVIIGGAGLAGMARRLATGCPVPLIDSVAAGVCCAQALARMHLRWRRNGR
ncbi:MAG TPA: aspartate/glutamate racemase family protein [Hyphomicrobiaceae bacterium]|nr:aspartate/glutamate racemase family protein [Hyphomicrobiaceae bacterium]